jgi:predicted nucleic acid-binding protein
VDTNIICYLYLNGEFSKLAEKVFKSDPEWAAPILWRSEFRNVLALYLRKGILEVQNSLKIMEEAEHLMKGNEFLIPSIKIMELVSASNCSAYDCEFVALAQDLNLSLITMDKNVLNQFPKIAKSPKSILK